jgi:transposase
MADSLGIVLVYLPPYSPDLNPIEQVWRGVRRKISQGLVKCERSFKETIKATFHLLAKRENFMEGWLNTFQPF